jgi:MOSC domain-containing protein YiiM
MTGRLVSINVSRGGVPKSSVFEALVTEHGVDGDQQRDLRFHGGPDRAVSLFSMEAIEALRAEGHPIAPGTIGENFTISGLDWPRIVPGAVLIVGAVRLEVTSYAAPCRNIRHSFVREDVARVSQKHHPGWSRVYTRVLEGGLVRPGEVVVVEWND